MNIKRKISFWYMTGFLWPPLVWLLICWGIRLWNIKELSEVAIAPQIISYVIVWFVGVFFYLRYLLNQIERGMSDPEKNFRTLSKYIVWLPKSFIVLILIYAFFYPLATLIGKEFIDVTELLLGEVMGIALIFSFSTPFFLRVDNLLANWTASVDLEEEKSMSLRVKLFLLVSGVVVGLLLLIFTAAFTVIYESKREFPIETFMIRVIPVIVTEILLAILIGFQMTMSLVGPLKELVDALKIVALGKRNGNQQLAITTRDEIGKLAYWFNRFTDLVQERRDFKRMIEEDRDIKSVYKRLYSFLREDFGFKDAIIYEVNNSKNHMKTVGDEEIKWCHPDILIDISRCRAVRTAHTVESFSRKDLCYSFSSPNEKCHVCLPVIVGGYIGNVIQLVFDKNTQKEEVIPKVEKLKILLQDVSSVIEAKRLLEQLRESSFRDALTGMYNRKFFQEYVEIIVSAVQRKQINVGLLMCDIDHFKKVNDIHGHDAGDEILKGIAKIFQDILRSSDLAIRYGGEEFLIILNETEPDYVMDVAERIRKRVASERFNVARIVLSLTISIGVSIFPLDSDNIWECIKFADIALYRAKESGRNRTVRFEPVLQEVLKSKNS